MDEWDAGQPLKEQPKTSWDEEDVDEDDIKDSWEDEDESEAPPLHPPKKVTKASVPGAKAVEKIPKVEVAKEEPLDTASEKLRQQRLVEESDFQSTTDLFSKRGDEKTVENFIPKSESDFLEYAEMLSFKIRFFEKSYYYVGLIKALMRLSMASLKASDAKEIASSASAIANEKLKAEREANAGKKKTGARKKQLHVGKDDDLVVDGYDGVEDYEFM